MTVRRHSRQLRIEWADCDPAGIVYFPRYFAFFDASTVLLLEHVLGMKKAEMLEHYDFAGIPTVDVRARFLIPSAYGDDVTIETEVTKFKRSSFDVRHRLLRDGALAVEGFETRVWVGRQPDDPKRIKAQTIPAEVIAKFG